MASDRERILTQYLHWLTFGCREAELRDSLSQLRHSQPTYIILFFLHETHIIRSERAKEDGGQYSRRGIVEDRATSILLYLNCVGSLGHVDIARSHVLRRSLLSTGVVQERWGGGPG